MGKYQARDIIFPNAMVVTGDEIERFNLNESDKYEWISKTNPRMDQCVGNTHFLCIVRHPEKDIVFMEEIPGYNNMLKFAISVANCGHYDVDVRANSGKNDERYKFTSHYNKKKDKVELTFESTTGVFEEEDPHIFMKPKED